MAHILFIISNANIVCDVIFFLFFIISWLDIKKEKEDNENKNNKSIPSIIEAAECCAFRSFKFLFLLRLRLTKVQQPFAWSHFFWLWRGFFLVSPWQRLIVSFGLNSYVINFVILHRSNVMEIFRIWCVGSGRARLFTMEWEKSLHCIENQNWIQ